jgi:hypothetical protein
MIEKLMPLNLPPGFYGNGTEYQAKNRWLEGLLVRFWNGTIRPVGGWKSIENTAGAEIGPVAECPRGAYSYRADGGDVRGAFGTTTTLEVITQGELFDITPGDLTPGACGGSFGDGSGEYGGGDYGAGPYGGVSLAGTLVDADTWSLDSFGDFLVGVLTSDGRVLVWEGDTAEDAAEATDAPQNNRAVVVTPERFLVALGADGDARLVKWASQETIDVWDPTADGSTAGEQPLATAGRLMAGRAWRHQTLLWTDVDIWSMNYIGGDFLYSFNKEGEGGLIGPNAVAVASSRVFWMGKNAFYTYDGFVQTINCDVADRVFSDMNYINRAQIFAIVVSEFNEIWWFYPGAGDSKPTKYVVYNWHEGHWVTGDLDRSAGFDRGAFAAPIWADDNGNVFEHEAVDGTYGGLLPYLQSGPIELGDGDRIYRLQQIVPDHIAAGSFTIMLRKRLFPMADFSNSTVYSVTGGSPVSIRDTARQVQIRVSGSLDTNWRLGTLRFGVRPQGRR